MNWQTVEAVGVWFAAVAAIVKAAFFLYYLKLMRAIQRATLEQAEGQLKPVIMVECLATLPKEKSAWQGGLVYPQIEGDRAQLINVGNGPDGGQRTPTLERPPDRRASGAAGN